jgi:hypothetical protein
MTLVLMDEAGAAQEALEKSPIHSLHRLRVDRSGNNLRILGRVKTFYLKQLAQEVVRHAVKDSLELRVVNEVRVD